MVIAGYLFFQEVPNYNSTSVAKAWSSLAARKLQYKTPNRCSSSQ